MEDSIKSDSECTSSNDQAPRNDAVTIFSAPTEVISERRSTDTTDNITEFRPKARFRAASLSYDWDHVVTSLEDTHKIRKVSRAGPLEDVPAVRHPGFVEIERTAHAFVGGSNYTGQWNGVGMAGKGNFVFSHDSWNLHNSRIFSVKICNFREKYGSEIIFNPRFFKMTDRMREGVKPFGNRNVSHDWDRVITADVSTPKNAGTRVKRHSISAFQLPHDGQTLVDKPNQDFCVESSYAGQWGSLGMEGLGSYDFPHDVDYEGNLRDGMFHGDGTLTYPMGQKLEGQWVNGKLVSYKFIFADGLEYDDPWKYCKMPDRRFYTSILEGLRPAGRSLLTNNHPTRKIPEGCYDTGDGFYNPATKCVWSAIKPNKILRVPTAAEEKWIMENCRKAWDEPTGYAPELFEHLVSGRKDDSVFHQRAEVDVPAPDKPKSNSVDVNMIVAPNYNVTPVSSSNWWESQSIPMENACK